MRTRIGWLVVAGIVLAVVGWLLLRRSSLPATQQSQTVATNPPLAVAPGATNAVAAVETNSVHVPAVFMTAVNRFITAANPYGLDGPIKAEDVIGVQDDQRRFMLETKTHLAEFFTKNLAVPQLHHFIATQDASNPVAEPEAKKRAMQQWYLATAPWTEQEALAETHRILDRLGIRTTWETQEARPAPIQVKNPQGENVQVIPFYNVTLKGPKAKIMAEFRMGQSGPGRLTEWYAILSADAVH